MVLTDAHIVPMRNWPKRGVVAETVQRLAQLTRVNEIPLFVVLTSRIAATDPRLPNDQQGNLALYASDQRLLVVDVDQPASAAWIPLNDVVTNFQMPESALGWRRSLAQHGTPRALQTIQGYVCLWISWGAAYQLRWESRVVDVLQDRLDRRGDAQQRSALAPEMKAPRSEQSVFCGQCGARFTELEEVYCGECGVPRAP